LSIVLTRFCLFVVVVVADSDSQNPDMFKNGSAAIYGMAESLPDGSVIDDMARGFIDTLYTQ